MNAFLKICFALVLRFENFKNKYRLLFYSYMYGKDVNIDQTSRFEKGSSISKITPDAKIVIGRFNYFRRFCSVVVTDAGLISIGDNNFFNNYCSINCVGKVEIGNDNLFGEGVRMFDTNHRFRDKTKLIREQGTKVGQIIIGNNCWIGSNVIILSGVTIGDNVVIGANNLVSKSIPDNTLVKMVNDQQFISI